MPDVLQKTAASPTLNHEQELAADGFFEFLHSQDKEMIISGPGGVGKTVLMGHLIDQVMPRYHKTCELMGISPEYDEVVMTATTNKAAEVLSLASKRPTETIYSFLGLKPHDDYSTGRSQLIKTRSWTVHQRKIVFVDECSMIDFNLRSLLHEGTHQSKIVYVGDHCQLAPVGETLSPIYQDSLPFFELTQPMRNADQPALMQICQQLRDTVETGVFKPIQVVPGVIDWVNDAEMQQMIDHTFQRQTRDSRILAYTNARVIEYNEHIRGIRGLPQEYHEGEFLVNNSAFTLGKSMLSVEEEVELLEQNSLIENITLPDEGIIQVRKTKLRSRLGTVFSGVPLAIDREHHAALLKYYGRKKDWISYGMLKRTIPDLRPRDAATVHKSQGSTYDTVFLDVGNLSTCHLANVVARLLYVGFTRAKSRVVLYGELAQKYGGIIN